MLLYMAVFADVLCGLRQIALSMSDASSHPIPTSITLLGRKGLASTLKVRALHIKSS
jgi:hypothetical protein